ncbi:hypothetical protein VNO80_06505 [Phaseolus coccineus]|uniref:Uncharacterized protein n=1 Tax=Phaseolus coccineus TaxID=3886 RepID=A0AAN9NLW2_PHACN
MLIYSLRFTIYSISLNLSDCIYNHYVKSNMFTVVSYSDLNMYDNIVIRFGARYCDCEAAKERCMALPFTLA